MSHAPKHAMLIALADDRLSESGRRRAMRHLERCGVCQSAQADHAQRAELTELLREVPVPTIDYERMALSLRQVARAEATRQSRRTLVGALAIAAALALVVLTGSRFLAEAPTTQTTGSTAPSVPTDAPTTGAATTSNGQPREAANAPGANPTGDAHPHLAVGTYDPTSDASLLDEGKVLRADTADLRVSLWEGTEFTLLKGSIARVTSFRNHRLHLELLRGSVSNQVAPLQEGERYAIAAHRHIVNVVGTRFAVSLSESNVASVDLHEGKVLVTRDGTRIASLVAPASWREEVDPTPGLKLISTGRTLLDDGSPAPQERAVTKPSDTGGRAQGSGSVAPKSVQHLMARAAPLLRRCHEQAKRAQPDLPDGVVLELSVGAEGRVADVQVVAEGAQLPTNFVACLRAHALRWHFPLTEPGAVTLRIPVQFPAPAASAKPTP